MSSCDVTDRFLLSCRQLFKIQNRPSPFSRHRGVEDAADGATRRSATRCGKAGCRNGAVKRKPRRRRSITAPEEEYVDRRSATRGRYKHRKRRKQDVASVLDSFPFDSTKPTAADAPEGSHGESNDGVASESLLEGESIELLFIKIKIIQMIGYYLI